MIKIEVSGHWDGVDDEGNRIYGKFYDVVNMPDLPNTVEGKKRELEYYKEYIDYYSAMLPDREEIEQEYKKARQIWLGTGKELEKHKWFFLRIFNSSKVDALRLQEEKSYSEMKECEDWLENYEFLDFVKHRYDLALEELKELESIK